jgi:para-aminobenzoate synthetase component I
MTGAALPRFARRLGFWIDPADVFVTLYSRDETSFWLDREVHPTESFSVMGHASNSQVVSAAELFQALDKPFSAAQPTEIYSADGTPIDGLPFNWRPGYVGWFDYQQNPLDPAALFGTWLVAREAVLFDHNARNLWLIGDFESREAFTEWVNAALIRLGLSGGQRIGYLHRNRATDAARVLSMAHSPAEYEGLVTQAKSHIAAGDVYQLCLTNRLEIEHSSNPLAVFLTLRALNPAPYAAYLRVGETHVVSVSPEQFLTVNASGEAVTRPIKGTRPRNLDEDLDRRIAAELADHPKERAENLMIVDLMRNDLARVSQPESVKVEELFSVEAHPTVHQLVSTISSRLHPDTTLRELVHSVFPGGSMTGAPKIRAMELIEVMEGVPRGVYSGVVGYISTDGPLDLGMVIRTIIFEGDRASIGVGGGITIDSDPAQEVAETELKALALLRVLGVESPWA